MKATGIVRRIDDLGRVVIPKEIRRNMNIREGDPLEIFIEDGGVVFKKYSLLSSFAPQAAHIQKVLSINGISASVFDNSSLLCGPRPFGMSKTPDEWLNIRNWGTEWKGKSLFVTPIIAEGEVIGFICYKNDKESAHSTFCAISSSICRKLRGLRPSFFISKFRRRADAHSAPSFLVCKFYTIFDLKSCAICHLAIILKLWYY